MTLKNTAWFTLIITGIFAVALALALRTPAVLGSEPSLLPGTIATTSKPTVGTFAISVFPTSTCAARIVTTYANAVMITFSDFKGETPTAIFGHLQVASTTGEYGSGVYGCGLVKIYGFTASTTITVSESR